jgi:uncharacterized membrane protein YkvA (DUF1232 family)
MKLFKLWRLQDVRLLASALRSRTRPAWLWPVTILLVLFAIEPANFGLPALGIVDDLILLPLLLRLVVKLSGADRLQVISPRSHRA